jgi:hypothetical protein
MLPQIPYKPRNRGKNARGMKVNDVHVLVDKIPVITLCVYEDEIDAMSLLDQRVGDSDHHTLRTAPIQGRHVEANV